MLNLSQITGKWILFSGTSNFQILCDCSCKFKEPRLHNERNQSESCKNRWKFDVTLKEPVQTANLKAMWFNCIALIFKCTLERWRAVPMVCRKHSSEIELVLSVNVYVHSTVVNNTPEAHSSWYVTCVHHHQSGALEHFENGIRTGEHVICIFYFIFIGNAILRSAVLHVSFPLSLASSANWIDLIGFRLCVGNAPTFCA